MPSVEEYPVDMPSFSDDAREGRIKFATDGVVVKRCVVRVFIIAKLFKISWCVFFPMVGEFASEELVEKRSEMQAEKQFANVSGRPRVGLLQVGGQRRQPEPPQCMPPWSCCLLLNPPFFVPETEFVLFPPFFWWG